MSLFRPLSGDSPPPAVQSPDPCGATGGALVAPQRVSVLVLSEARALDGRTFTYAVPSHLAPGLCVGMPVRVPLGRQAGLTGLVVAVDPPLESLRALREIDEVLADTPLFDACDLALWRWVADYYAAPLASVIACALPGGLLHKIRREVVLVPQAIPPGGAATLEPQAARLLAFLQARGKAFTPRYLAAQLEYTPQVLSRCLKGLCDLGWLRVQTHLGSGVTKARPVRRVTLQTDPQTPPLPDENVSSEALRRQQVVRHLAQSGGVLWKRDLQTHTGASDRLLAALVRAGSIRIDTLPPIAALWPPGVSGPQERRITLNPDQQRAVTAIASSPPDEQPWLLYGVTGSGKTEVYLALCERALADGHSVMVLVPEIALTSQIAQRFIQRFGWETVALWHSDLSQGERLDAWAMLRRGERRVVIGARSAAFLPMRDLGLIILDEAHDGSFKQESPAPRYHALTLAQERARRSGARLVLGSATPDVAQYWQAHRAGRVVRLPARVAGRDRACVSLLDMRCEPLARRGGVIARALQEALLETLARGEQALILMNRRGFHTLIQCGGCGHVFQCPSCAVALTAHESGRITRCHHCGYQGAAPQYCPHCASMAVIQRGAGTQRVAAELAILAPQARILRLDSDVMGRRREAQAILAQFGAGEADVLVGTQMVAKGLDVANVTLVGVIQADSAFSLPDYRASERGFQLLTQVAGRAGRGEKPGIALLQTLNPDHPVIRLAQAQDYDGFFSHELAVRQTFGFPPFSQLFRLIVSGEEEAAVQRYASALVAHLQAQAIASPKPDAEATLLGPAPCVISRLQDRSRYHILIKSTGADAVRQRLTRFIEALSPPDGLSLLLDVDAQSLL